MTAVSTSADSDLSANRRFFAGAGLPAFLLAGAVVYAAFLISVIFAPAGSGLWGRFAGDFKAWCFSYDARTGGMTWAAAWVMLVEPLFLAGIGVLLWRRQLRGLFSWRGLAGHWKALAGGGLLALLAAGGLFAYASNSGADAGAAVPFPGSRIRTQIVPPAFALTDHKGATVSLAGLEGKVVIITGVYAQCSTACPQILRELKTVTDSVPADLRKNLSIVALSLNPEYDTGEFMNAVAAAYGFEYPMFRYLNGEPEIMRDLLTRLQFSPVRNPETGAIDHANLFLLVDSKGRIAYRLGLDARQVSWLRDATMDLLSETNRPTGHEGAPK